MAAHHGAAPAAAFGARSRSSSACGGAAGLWCPRRPFLPSRGSFSFTLLRTSRSSACARPSSRLISSRSLSAFRAASCGETALRPLDRGSSAATIPCSARSSSA